MIDQLNSEVINTLTQSEISALRYIDAHPKEIINMSIQECAQKTFSSTATILRLCKKINLSGFSELKFILKQQILKSEKINFSSKNNNLIINKLYKNIENTARLINPKELDKLVSLLIGNKKIYLYGGGITTAPMKYLEKYLFSVNKPVVFYKTPPMAYRGVCNLTENDIIIIASASGSTSSIIKIAQLAKNSKAFIVAITDFNPNPLAQLADISFYTFTEERTYYGTDIKSRFGIFFIINMIMEAYIFRMNKTDSFIIKEKKL